MCYRFKLHSHNPIVITIKTIETIQFGFTPKKQQSKARKSTYANTTYITVYSDNVYPSNVFV